MKIEATIVIKHEVRDLYDPHTWNRGDDLTGEIVYNAATTNGLRTITITTTDGRQYTFYRDDIEVLSTSERIAQHNVIKAISKQHNVSYAAIAAGYDAGFEHGRDAGYDAGYDALLMQI